MKFRALALAAVFLAAPLAQAEIAHDPKLAPAGKYEADPRHTKILWKINHLGFSYYNGWFTKFDARLGFDPAAPEKTSLDVSIDTTSVHTGTESFDHEIAGHMFLDADKTNPIRFVSTSAAMTSANTGTITGKLTLHGVTKPATFNVTLIGAGMSAMKGTFVLGFEATTTIKRSDFGITAYLDAGLGDEVMITVDGEFDNKP